jgi:hypothetical protein
MTTRNFRVKNGLSVGDITISATANTITGLATSAPSGDGDVANKKYVDDSINAISTTSITTDSNATNATVSGTGASGTLTITANSNTEVTVTDSGMQLGGSGARVNSILDEDAMGSDSATALATQQSIKAYVDAQVTASDLDFQGDSGGALSIDLDSEVLDIAGGTGIDTTGSGNTLTVAIDSTVATLAGTQTFTNKTFDADGTGNSLSNIDAGNLKSGFLLDEDNLISNSATALATQQSIKAYVDNGLSALSSTTIEEGNSSVDVDDGAGGAGQVIVNVDGNNELVINDTSATFSGNVVVSGNFTVNGTTTTVATANTVVSDSLMELGNGTTGAPANDAGLVIERGDSNNAFIGWDESADKFIVGTGTFTGASTGNLTITSGTLVAATFEGNLTGTATAAEYSDVAERFASDTAYEPGTVVALGGAAEITAVNEEASDEVFGVISSLDQAAFKMNGGAGTDETHPYIAMTGRVNVKVIGTVNKGDRLISASVPGYARAATKAECTAFNVIGRALTNKDVAGPGSVLAAVRVSH